MLEALQVSGGLISKGLFSPKVNEIHESLFSSFDFFSTPRRFFTPEIQLPDEGLLFETVIEPIRLGSPSEIV